MRCKGALLINQLTFFVMDLKPVCISQIKFSSIQKVKAG